MNYELFLYFCNDYGKKASSTHCHYPRSGAHRLSGRCHFTLRQRLPQRRQSDSPADGYGRLRHPLDDHLQDTLANVRTTDQDDHRRGEHHLAHSSLCRYVGWFVDDQRYRSHLNILWGPDYVTPVLPDIVLSHLCSGIAALWQFVDYHRHHRCGITWYRPCTGNL